MQEKFPHHDDPEKLREENEFLKLKLMLEHGAELGGNMDVDLPPEIEHQFLTNVLAFEKQFDERKTIKIYDKIGRPVHFRSPAEIGDEIAKAWEELREHLNNYGIDLNACSPNVSQRELYRFTIEELFQHEMDDIDLPGWTTNFIYDEFHPDIIYDNTQLALNHCLQMIFSKDPLEWMHHFMEQKIRFNEYFPLDREGFQHIINRFKDCYDEIELTGTTDISCIIEDGRCTVKGNYTAEAITQNEKTCFSGAWIVVLEIGGEMEYGGIKEIQIGGLSF